MAADACIVSGMSGTHVEVASALAMAQAFGVPAARAATLIAACANGLMTGQAERRAKEAEASPSEP